MIRIKLSRKLGDVRMTQTELSRRTGIGTPAINEIYNELRDTIKLEHLDRICTALQCDLTEILEHRLEPSKLLNQKRLEEAEARAKRARTLEGNGPAAPYHTDE